MLTTLPAGNWRKFDSFAWLDRPDNADEYCIVYTCNRDSGLIDKSNAAIIAKALEPFVDSGEARPEHHGHWACGWVDGWAIKVGSAAEQVYLELAERMADYPILDESHYSDLEHEAQNESWESWARQDFTRELERAFGIDIDADSEALRELFDTLAERANEYWTEDSINVQSIASEATADDVREHTLPQALRVFQDGAFYADGLFHVLACIADCPLYQDVFDAIAEANAQGAESINLDGAVYTWTIE
jgi:hypothetical protein